MKIIHPLALGALFVGAVSFAGADEPAIKFATPGQTPAAAPDDPQVVEELGWLVAKQFSLPDLGFSPSQAKLLVSGFSAAVQGQPPPYDLQKMGPAVDAMMRKKQAVLLGQVRQRNLSQTAAFFTKLKDNKAVVELPSGLRYEILKPGDGRNPKPTDTVKVHYTGTLIDGTVFDSSVQRGQPVELALNQVIPGWTEGIQKINKGGKIRLYIPPHLAYGDDGRPGIPPASTLIFEVELLDIKAAPPPKGG